VRWLLVTAHVMQYRMLDTSGGLGNQHVNKTVRKSSTSEKMDTWLPTESFDCTAIFALVVVGSRGTKRIFVP
jgi:hypothetical protein